MKGRGKAFAIGVASAVVTFALVSLATAGWGATTPPSEATAVDESGVPEGPFIDFCPTQEQIEAHLEKYGFDYKPSVACAEDGKELAPADDAEEGVSEEELFASEKQALLTATRAPDTDGDPLTMEIILADGTRTTIFIDGDPKLFKDMTPAEYAQIVYP